MDFFKFLMGLIGHLGIWCVLFNRIHATAWPRSTRKGSEKAILLAVAIPIVWVGSMMFLKGQFSTGAISTHPITFYYFFACFWLGLFFTGRWIWRKVCVRLPASVIAKTIEVIDLRGESKVPLSHGPIVKFLTGIPLNEALQLSIQRMTFEMRVPNQLDGLKICQLSDLHYTGQIGIEYFQRIIEEANRFEPDLIVITGDIVDQPECLDWLNETLGRLKANLGVYYVLGNHDRRIRNESELRRRIEETGAIQASGKWHNVEFNGATIQLTGNELPWYRDVERLSPAVHHNPDLKLLLSHSPDQIEWAIKHEFELMLAGHTHGGQIALPFIGPLVAPSKYGVLFASGTFQVKNVLMHVSRGISGDEPVRFCSPPELGLFTIRSTEERNGNARQ